MERMEEYKILTQDLENLPARLDGTVSRARARAGKHRIRKLIETPLAGVAAVFALFVLLVNLSVPFALACSSVPVLKQLTAAVAFSPSLRAAVQHDYVQYMGLEESSGGISMSVDYVIVDQKQVNIFCTVQGNAPRYSVIPEIRGAQGGALEGYGLIGGSPVEPGSLQKFVVDFMQGDVPPELQLSCEVFPLEAEQAETPVRADGETPDRTEPDPAATLVFDLHFDPAYTGAGETVALDRYFTLDGQRLLAEDVEIYPTHVRLNLGDDGGNSAWLRSLDFYLEDERGNRYEKIGNGITATGSEGSPFMSGHRLESSYFGDAEHLTLYITGATWLDKEMEFVEVDLESGTAGTLPEGVRLEGVEPVGGNGYYISVSAPCGENGSFYELLRWDYLDQAGEERSFNSKSTGTDNDPGRFVERIRLENYPDRTVRLGLSSSRRTQLAAPLEIRIK